MQVNRKNKKCPFEARDKELLMKEIKHLHDKGLSQVDISKVLKISRGTILRWNKEQNFFSPRQPGEAGKLKSKIYAYDEDIFENTMDPNLAYIVGFIMGDGCIHDRSKSKRLAISIAISDKQILKDMAIYMNMVGLLKIRMASVESEQDKICLTVSCTKICNDLSKYGIVPKKTGKEIFPFWLSTNCKWAFLRGFFDADGHIRKYKRYGYDKVKFTLTGNKPMMVQIINFLKSENILPPKKAIYEKIGCVSFEMSSIKTLQTLYQKMYAEDTGHLRLERKEKVFKLINSIS